MKNGENYSRRRFLRNLGLAAAMAPLLQYCQKTVGRWVVRLSGTRHLLGHRLWAMDFPVPTEVRTVPYLIVGGGIAGLSAARQLVRNGITDFLIVELEGHLGGNASNGENAYSKFPLGAHYLPLPNAHDTALLDFLREEKIITGQRDGYPQFDETQLCLAPQERLFYQNSWQEGLIPKNLSKPDRMDFDGFFAKMNAYQHAKGDDGKFLFDIPLKNSSEDPATRALDRLSMQEWMQQQGWRSEVLHQYVDYCCRDDFGLGVAYVSAWAGVHYFAGRKHDATPGGRESVLTWPEGNARLAGHLQKYVKGRTLAGHLAYRVAPQQGHVSVFLFSAAKAQSVQINADRVLMATPQFVNQYLLPNRKAMASKFHYAPWLLATLTVTELEDNGSYPLCWDNVIYGSKGLGYVYDQHQSLAQLQPRKVITFYYSFSGPDVRKLRRQLYKATQFELEQWVLDDLRIAHPEIESQIESIAIHRLGHGMVSPVKGFLWDPVRTQAAAPIDNRVFFAHSDLSGISIFEEAFHQGIDAANDMMHAATLDS